MHHGTRHVPTSLGSRTKGPPKKKMVKDGKLDKHGKVIPGVTPASWTSSYVDLSVTGEPDTIPTQRAQEHDAESEVATTAGLEEVDEEISEKKRKRRSDASTMEVEETEEQRKERKRLKKEKKAAEAAASGAESASEKKEKKKKKKRESEAADDDE